jgi:hypothetical protein
VDAADLYQLPPEDFTAARDAAAKQAKADGDRSAAAELKALRRPSVAAWLVNRLAQTESELLDSLLALGPELAEAQAAGSGDLLRELGAQRRSLVDAVTDRAVRLAERDVAPAVRVEVSDTLEAALADPASAQAVRSGRLVRGLSYAGFGGVDLDGAVAAPAERSGPPGPKGDRSVARDEAAGPARRKPGGKAGREVAEAEAAALAAAGELDDAVRSCERLSGEAEQAAHAVAGAREQAAQAEAALVTAQQAVRDAELAAQEAERAAERARQVTTQGEERSRRAAELSAQAVERVRAAQVAAERSRAALDALRRSQS